MTRVGVALGSNVGDRMQNLRMARYAIEALPERSGALIASPVFETEPVDCDDGAADFLNAVIEIGYGGDAVALLNALRAAEAQLGRPAVRHRNAPRAVDLDLLYFGHEVIETDELTVPHPRMHTRGFVLRPLAEIRPELILPGQRFSVEELARSLDPRPAVVRAEVQW